MGTGGLPSDDCASAAVTECWRSELTHVSMAAALSARKTKALWCPFSKADDLSPVFTDFIVPPACGWSSKVAPDAAARTSMFSSGMKPIGSLSFGDLK